LSLTCHDDDLNQTKIEDPYGGISYERTDAVGNLTEDIDPLGRSYRHSYDKRNRKVQTIDPKGGFTLYTYTADDRTKTIRDAVLNTTTYTYDVTGRLTTEQTSSGTRLYTYDDVDNLTSVRDRNGQTTNYTYDNLDRIKTELWVDDGQTFTYTYDENRNRLTAEDGNIKYVYSYDDTDLLATVERIQTLNPTVSFKYEYDDIGNLTTATEWIGTTLAATTVYEYDDPRYLNTKISQTGAGFDLANKEVKFTYDAAGLNTRVERYVDGLLKVETTNAYDDYGRLTGIEHRNGANVVIGSSSYIIDDLDRLKTETVDAQSRTIGYDSIDQVKTVTGSNNEAYTYDLNGNRINPGYETGADNRLLSDGTYSYVYDAEGNRTQRTETATGIVDRYTWDYRNRLMSIVTVASGGAVIQTVEYEYDVDDRRVSKTITSALPTGGVVENYFIDRDQIAFVTDGSGQETFHYLYGLNVDAVMAQDSNTGMLWALADRLGSIDTLTDEDGVVVDKRSFDSFGRVLSETNPTVSFRYGYTGRERDLESGLSYYRARYYDPNVGRFISRPPAKVRSSCKIDKKSTNRK
jgi:RHS repeat-associated protein